MKPQDIDQISVMRAASSAGSGRTHRLRCSTIRQSIANPVRHFRCQQGVCPSMAAFPAIHDRDVPVCPPAAYGPIALSMWSPLRRSGRAWPGAAGQFSSIWNLGSHRRIKIVLFPNGGPLPRHIRASASMKACWKVSCFSSFCACSPNSAETEGPRFVWRIHLYSKTSRICRILREPDAHIGYLAGSWSHGHAALPLPMVLLGIWALLATAKVCPLRCKHRQGWENVAELIAAQPHSGQRVYGAVPVWTRPWLLYDPREPFGAGGDFITAPEISQMSGAHRSLALSG